MPGIENPLVSIAMTVFNAAPFLVKTLNSILAQDYGDLELIISDNCSDDGTSEICRNYAKIDGRIRYFRNISNMGATRNSYKAIDMCSADFIMHAADHDLYHPTFISRLMEVLKHDPTVVLAYPRTLYIDEIDNVLDLCPDVIDTRGMQVCQRFSKNIWEFGWMNMIYGVYRSAPFKSVWHAHPTIGADHVIIANLCLLGTIAQINEPLFFRRRNRPDETMQECTIRQLKSISGANLEKLIPWTKLAYEHIKVVTESGLDEYDKDFLCEDIRKCFPARFGDFMRGEVAQLIAESPIILSNPKALQNLYDYRKAEIARVALMCSFFYPESAELDGLISGAFCGIVGSVGANALMPSLDIISDTNFYKTVSVIIPTHNRESLITRAIESVIAQTYPIHEIVVVDDASSDNTESLIHDLQDRYRQIKYYKIEKGGAQAARNEGIRKASGEWIAFLDSDDEFLPDKIKKQIELAEREDVSVVHCECYVVRGEQSPVLFGTPPFVGNIHKHMLRSPSITFPSLLVKKNALESIGFLDELVPSFQEWDTIIRLSRDYEFGCVSDALYIYHCHSNETISKDMKRHACGYAYIIEKFSLDILSHTGPEVLAHHYQSLVQQGRDYNVPEIEKLYVQKLFLLIERNALPSSVIMSKESSKLFAGDIVDNGLRQAMICANTVKILFTTAVIEHPPANDQTIRIENSIKYLDKMSELHVAVRIPQQNFGGESAVDFYRNHSHFFGFTPRLSGSENKEDEFVNAQTLVRHAVDNGISIIWCGCANISCYLIEAVKQINPNLIVVTDS